MKGGSEVHALFLDASKAFDRVKHEKLFQCLIDRNFCPLYIRLIYMMYSLNNSIVKWRNKTSDPFYMSNGVKQGGVLSPYLFALYLDPLLDKINKCKYGCYVGNNPCNIFAFADDVVLLSPTVGGLKKMSEICESYGQEYSVRFNPTKSQILSFSGFNSNFEILLNNEKIEKTNTVKHLGFVLNNFRSYYNFENVINDMKVRTNVIDTNFKYLDTDSRIKLFTSQWMILYCACLWDLSANDINKLEVAWRKSCRIILQLPPRTYNNLIPP